MNLIKLILKMLIINIKANENVRFFYCIKKQNKSSKNI